MAYKDLGRLVTLDYHAEYFLELVVVYFVSEVTGLNYILVYAFIIRVVSILCWTVLFLWASNVLSKSYVQRQLFLLLIAFSMLIANSGYNFEYSFAPVLLLALYLIVARKQRSYEFTLVALIVALAIMLASFRETFVMALICLFAVSVMVLMRRINPSSPLAVASPPILMLLALFTSRIFQFSSHYYVESYSNKLLALMNSILAALGGDWTLSGKPLSTVVSIGNPLDKAIALISIVSAMSCMTMLVMLSLGYLLRERNTDAFFFSIPMAYVLALSIPVASYSVMMITGAGTIRDFGSATVLSRSLIPLVTLTIIPYLMHTRMQKKRNRTSMTKFLMFLAVICLSFSVVFAPFLFLRGEVKSSYDMNIVERDDNEIFVMGTGVYYFLISHATPSETIVISPMREPSSNYLFFIYYVLPLARARIGK